MTTNTVPIPDTPELQDMDRNSLKVYMIPSWIFSTFTSKYNLMEIHDYGKLRSVASAIDIAHMEIMRKVLFSKLTLSKLEPGYLQYSIKSFIEDYLYLNTPDAQNPDRHSVEIKSTVEYLVNQPDVIEEAINRLKKIEKANQCEEAVPIGGGNNTWALVNDNVGTTSPLYRLIVSTDKLYIVVEEGFLSQIETVVNFKAFLTQVLKSAYAIASIPVVNSTLWYKLYLEVLAAEA